MDKKKFKIALINAEMKQSALAKSIGMSPGGLNNKAIGKNEFRSTEILKIAKVLHLSMDDVNSIFFDGEVN